MKYMDKKDNKSSKASRAKNINFAYFEELDLIFGNDPNVDSVAIAPSSRGTENLKNCNISNVVDPEVSDAVEPSKASISENILPGISNDGKKNKGIKRYSTPKRKRQKCSHGELFKEIARK
ncbi:hypothetical protein QE152_g31892 [Popillia japonica]|uniref:Uncharacterized protein n=1 Tax=Popillia japonica TaxID=7064 RepID=A0AAW1J115_POPJA